MTIIIRGPRRKPVPFRWRCLKPDEDLPTFGIIKEVNMSDEEKRLNMEDKPEADAPSTDVDVDVSVEQPAQSDGDDSSGGDAGEASGDE